MKRKTIAGSVASMTFAMPFLAGAAEISDALVVNPNQPNEAVRIHFKQPLSDSDVRSLEKFLNSQGLAVSFKHPALSKPASQPSEKTDPSALLRTVSQMVGDAAVVRSVPVSQMALGSQEVTRANR